MKHFLDIKSNAIGGYLVTWKMSMIQGFFLKHSMVQFLYIWKSSCTEKTQGRYRSLHTKRFRVIGFRCWYYYLIFCFAYLYSWSLNNVRHWRSRSLTQSKIWIKLLTPPNFSHLPVSAEGRFQKPSRHPNSRMLKPLFINWHRTMCTVGPLHPSIDSQPGTENTVFQPWLFESADAKPRDMGIWRADCIFIEKNLHVREPMQFKPVRFKTQLYLLFSNKINV